DLAVLDMGDRDSADGDLLAGRRNPHQLALVRSAPRPAGGNQISFRELLVDRDPAVGEPGQIPGDELLDSLRALRVRLGRIVADGPELLHRHVARGPDLGARDDPGGPVLVPDPDVLHLQMEERIVRLRDLSEIELVAEVRGVLSENAVPEEAEDGGVFLLQLELELGLELVELVEITHAVESSLARRAWTEPWPGTSRSGSSSASGSSTNRRSR